MIDAKWLQGVIANTNTMFLITFVLAAFTGVVDIALATWGNLGEVVQIVGGFGDGGSIQFLKQFMGLLKIVNLDFKFARPGCAGTSSLFVPFYWANLKLMSDYAMPAVFGIGFFAAIGLIGEIAGRGLQYRRLHARCIWMRRTYNPRLVGVVAITIEMMYLQLVKNSLWAVLCIPVGVSKERKWRMKMELAQECFTPEHVPVFLVSALILVVLVIAYPIFVVYTVEKWRKAKLHRTPSKRLKLGHLYAPVKDKYWLYFLQGWLMKWLLACSSLVGERTPSFLMVAIPIVFITFFQVWKKPLGSPYMRVVDPGRLMLQTVAGFAMLFFENASMAMQNIVCTLVFVVIFAIIIARVGIPTVRYVMKQNRTLRSGVNSVSRRLSRVASRRPRGLWQPLPVWQTADPSHTC